MSSSQNLIHHPCLVCCRPTSMWCSRCETSWYCSAEHLQSDWPRHRRECNPAHVHQQPHIVDGAGGNNGATSGHGVPSHHVVIQTPPPAVPELMTVSALLFLPNQERASVVQVSCQMSRKPSSNACPTPLLSSYFPEAPNHAPQSIVLTQGLNGEPLRFPLHIFYCPTALQRGTPVNRAIFRITSGAAPRAWPGPVVVLKYNGSRRQSYSDASTNDLPALSAYFLAFK